ncbi:MAG: hypothetical protein WD470_12820, partial [Rhodospirillaceae bacterium]
MSRHYSCRSRFFAALGLSLATLCVVAVPAAPTAAQTGTAVAQNDFPARGGGDTGIRREADAPAAWLDRAIGDLRAARRTLAGAAGGRHAADTGEARRLGRSALAEIESALAVLPRAQAPEDRKAYDLVRTEISQAREALSDAGSEPAVAAQALRTVEDSVAHARRQRDFGPPQAGHGRGGAIALPSDGRGPAGGGSSVSGPPAGDNPGSDAVIGRRLEDTIPAARVPDSDRVHFPVLDENNSRTYLDEAHGSPLLGRSLHAR